MKKYFSNLLEAIPRVDLTEFLEKGVYSKDCE